MMQIKIMQQIVLKEIDEDVGLKEGRIESIRGLHTH